MLETSTMLNRTLTALEYYCSINKLTVNSKKMNVVIFKKGCARADNKKFFYFKEEAPKIVSQYTYLGIDFTKSGTLDTATKSILRKAALAANPVASKINHIELGSWTQKTTFYICSWPQHSATCAPYRSLYTYPCLNNSSADFSSLSWPFLLEHEPSKYPKNCLESLIENLNKNNTGNNRVSQVKSNFFEPIDELSIRKNLNLLTNNKTRKRLVEKYTRHLRNEDLEKI
ncbi:hypothetical protein TKK_0015551 [Trichogramma kaykai]